MTWGLALVISKYCRVFIHIFIPSIFNYTTVNSELRFAQSFAVISHHIWIVSVKTFLEPWFYFSRNGKQNKQNGVSWVIKWKSKTFRLLFPIIKCIYMSSLTQDYFRWNLMYGFRRYLMSLIWMQNTTSPLEQNVTLPENLGANARIT